MQHEQDPKMHHNSTCKKLTLMMVNENRNKGLVEVRQTIFRIREKIQKCNSFRKRSIPLNG